MKFVIDYPAGMIEPRGLHIPRLEDIQQSVRLAEIIAQYIDPILEDDDVFPVTVCDEVFILEGKLVDASSIEGITLYPSAIPWTVESISEVMLPSLFGDKEIVTIPKVNLIEVAESMKILINFIWDLQDKLPIIKEFCDEHEYIIDTSISLSEKAS